MWMFVVNMLLTLPEEIQLKKLLRNIQIVSVFNLNGLLMCACVMLCIANEDIDLPESDMTLSNATFCFLLPINKLDLSTLLILKKFILEVIKKVHLLL